MNNKDKMDKKEIIFLFSFSLVVTIINVLMICCFFTEISAEQFSLIFEAFSKKTLYCTLCLAPLILIFNVFVCFFCMFFYSSIIKPKTEVKEVEKKGTKRKTTKKSTTK